MPGLRTGAEYRESLRDGRKVWVLGEGAVDDVTTHPATRAMVDEYVAWYDRHFDPAWQDTLLNDGLPWGYTLPKRADDLVGMGRCFAATTFLSAGNITHTPAYGHLIALGILGEVQQRNVSQQQIDNAEAYRQHIVKTGRFLTFSSGSATIGYRMRSDPAERAALRIVRETDRGLVIRGKIGMHTSPAYAEDIYIGGLCGVDYQGHRATFIVPVNAPGIRVICRRIATRDANPFVSPLSSRYDELDGQMWLDDVHVPWERVFLVDASPELIARWLFWHQLYCWLSKAEVTLGLALACTHAMGLMSDAGTNGYLLDLITDVQTVRSCLVAAERDPQFTAAGYCYPNICHLSAGSIAMLKARPGMSEMLRILPAPRWSSPPPTVISPRRSSRLDSRRRSAAADTPRCSAPRCCRWPGIMCRRRWMARESAFELHANGGIPRWRERLRQGFGSYNELANGVLRQLGVAMPEIDLTSLRAAPAVPRRQVDLGGKR